MIDVISVKNMRKSDEKTIFSKVDGKTLMWRAALGVYNAFSWHGKIGIICGKGNNAGDGYALALILKENGYNPTIVLTSDKFSVDGKYYYDLCLTKGIDVIDFSNVRENFDIVVDCLLGTGFKGKVSDDLKKVIEYINSSKEVVSVDINSGLNGDSGLGECVVKSDLTVSIGYLKSGLYLNKAKDYIKKIVNVDIGIDLNEKEYYLLEEEDIKKVIKERKNFSNKGTYGYVGVMGGSLSYPGAVRLANMGQSALYAGCGVSRVIVPDCIYELIFNNVLETTVFSLPSKNGKMIFVKEKILSSINGLKALGVGVGWDQDESYKEILEFLINNFDKPLVIDADGLNVLSKMDLNILNNNSKIILTPHLKEFSRLTGYEIDEIMNDSINILKEFVNKYNVTVLLKGPTTIIASRNNIYLVDKGCSGMATAGSGDVLTGVLVGLLGYSTEAIPLTVAVAAYINGRAGEYASQVYGNVGMVSSDSARSISYVIKNICKK